MNTMKLYTNGEITVIWRPDLCCHSGNCIRGLPRVFRADKKPWVDLTGASTAEIRRQCDECPSGALAWSIAGK